MYGNVVTNRQLRSLIESNCISIRPFDPTLLKEAAYTLNPGRILRRCVDGELDIVHTFSNSRQNFSIEPNEYVVVEAKQNVSISAQGIIGTFITASSNVENGLLIVAGQIDSKYGLNGEALRFGVKNLLDIPNQITVATRLVHMQLIDLRGSTSDPVHRGKDVSNVWASRQTDWKWGDQEKGGPNYGNATE